MRIIFSEDDEDSTVVGSHHWSLPNAEFEGYWENLIFDLNIKEKVEILFCSRFDSNLKCFLTLFRS